MNLDIRGISYHVEIKGKDFHLFYCMVLQEMQQHGTLLLSNGVINGHVFAIDIIGHGKIRFTRRY